MNASDLAILTLLGKLDEQQIIPINEGPTEGWEEIGVLPELLQKLYSFALSHERTQEHLALEVKHCDDPEKKPDIVKRWQIELRLADLLRPLIWNEVLTLFDLTHHHTEVQIASGYRVFKHVILVDDEEEPRSTFCGASPSITRLVEDPPDESAD